MKNVMTRIKQILSLTMSVAMLVTMVPSITFAAEAEPVDVINYDIAEENADTLDVVDYDSVNNDALEDDNAELLVTGVQQINAPLKNISTNAIQGTISVAYASVGNKLTARISFDKVKFPERADGESVYLYITAKSDEPMTSTKANEVYGLVQLYDSDITRIEESSQRKPYMYTLTWSNFFDKTVSSGIKKKTDPTFIYYNVTAVVTKFNESSYEQEITSSSNIAESIYVFEGSYPTVKPTLEQVNTTPVTVEGIVKFDKSQISVKDDEALIAVVIAESKTKFADVSADEKDEETGLYSTSISLPLTKEEYDKGEKNFSWQLFDDDLLKPAAVTVSAFVRHIKLYNGNAVVAKDKSNLYKKTITSDEKKVNVAPNPDRKNYIKFNPNGGSFSLDMFNSSDAQYEVVKEDPSLSLKYNLIKKDNINTLEGCYSFNQLVPSKDGYEFAGWYFENANGEPDVTKKFNFSNMPASTTIVVARWIETLPGTVGFDFEGVNGTSIKINNIKVEDGYIPYLLDDDGNSTSDEAYMLYYMVSSKVMMMYGSKSPDEDGYYTYWNSIPLEGDDLARLIDDHEIKDKTIEVFKTPVTEDTYLSLSRLAIYRVSKISGKAVIANDESNVTARSHHPARYEKPVVLRAKSTPISTIKVASVNKGEIKQDKFTTKSYKITVQPNNYTGAVAVKAVNASNEDITDEAVILSEDYTTLNIITDKEDFNVSVYAVDDSSIKCDFKVSVQNPKPLKTPNVKTAYTTEKAIGFTLTRDNKLVTPATGEYKFEIEAFEDDTFTNKISSNIVPIDLRFATQDVEFKVFDKALTENRTVAVRIRAIYENGGSEPANASPYKVNKKIQMYAPSYATKLSFKVNNRIVYTGQQDVNVATAEFNKEATYFLDPSSVVVAEKNAADASKEGPRPTANISADGRSVEISVFSNTPAIKYVVTAKTLTDGKSEAISKWFEFEVKNGRLDYAISANTVKMYKETNKQSTITVKFETPSGVKNKTIWSIEAISGNSTYKNRIAKYVKVNNGRVTIDRRYQVQHEEDVFRIRVSGVDYKGNPISAVTDPIRITSSASQIGSVYIVDKNGKVYANRTKDMLPNGTDGLKIVVCKGKIFDPEGIVPDGEYLLKLPKTIVKDDTTGLYKITKKGNISITATATDGSNRKASASIPVSQ